jgi:hypothetical protein
VRESAARRIPSDSESVFFIYQPRSKRTSTDGI